jgi:AcrR family transcriptional regulator
MPPRLSAAARREQLLDVALEVFAGQGYHGTSMNDVADAAGVTKPVLYQHFESKRELYLALLEAVGSRLITAISKAASEAPDGKAQTERGFEAFFRWVHDDRDAFRLVFGSGRRDEEFAEAVAKVEDASAEAIAPLIAADIDVEHQRTLAYGLVGLAEGVSRRLVSQDADFDPEIVARQVSNLAWAGLRAIGRPA